MMKNDILNTKKLGYKFYFQDGDNQIACFGSYFTGKEEVYINDDLVSSRRSVNIKSSHKFDFENSRYQVKFDMLNILTGRLECTLYKDQEVLAKQVQSSLPSDPKKAAFFILGCALGGAVFGYTTATVVELIVGKL
ncbi:hypothetical protein [Pseudoalteromonas tetraodonis]|uniref:hypothetical protein n=1 Tax=Pseudoalteromonas tetraodonis TaxID=43659 RepID=UPI003D07DD66